MTALHTFTPIRFVYKIRQAAADSWWVYRQNIGLNGSLSPISRVVFFGNSREQVDQWIQCKAEENVFVLSES